MFLPDYFPKAPKIASYCASLYLARLQLVIISSALCTSLRRTFPFWAKKIYLG